MTTIYLIRHAEADGNLYRRAHGHYDSTITDRGYLQIAALCRRLEGERIDAVYASDLTRTRTTALAAAYPRALPVQPNAALREVGVGVWEDHTWTYLARHDTEELIRFNTASATWHVAHGEDMAQVRDRMVGALRSIVAAHPGQAVAVFSHGMALRLLLGTLQGIPLTEIDRTPHGENTAVSKLEADGHGIRVLYRDDASHIPDEIATMRRQKWTKHKTGFETGVWFRPDGAREGRFLACGEDGQAVGAVTVSSCADGVATIGELCLAEDVRGNNYGIRLLGQALSCARARGCDRLRAALPPDDETAAYFARVWGFAPTGETAEGTVWEKYFGYDEAYRLRKFRAALAAR